jgi:hypothetical protein
VIGPQRARPASVAQIEAQTKQVRREMAETQKEAIHRSVESAIQAMVWPPGWSEGNITVEIKADGKPIDAVGFGETIITTARMLHHTARSVAPDAKLKCGIVEANIIGDHASFTLRLYDKAVFKGKKEPAE